MNRPLTESERNLVRWMLEHGQHEASDFLAQLEKAEVTPWRCPCGCASIEFSIPGSSKRSVGMRPVGEFVFGIGDDLSGIFVYENSGILGGVEVYGLAGDAPELLPSPEVLRPFESSNSRNGIIKKKACQANSVQPL